MVARESALVVLVLSVLLSGCLEGGGGLSASPSAVAGDNSDDPSETTQSSPPSTTTAPAPTQASEGPQNQPPVANVTVKRASETLAPDSDGVIAIKSGEAVTLNASGSKDPEGSDVTFLWTIDGETNDTTEPVLELMLADGYHEIELDVSDGVATGSLVVPIEVIGAVVQQGGGAANAVTYKFTSAFAAGSTTEHPQTPSAAATRPFEVPAGAQMLIANLRWSTSTAENPLVSDLDLVIKNPTGTAELTADGTRTFEYGTITDAGKLVAGTWNADVIPFLAPVNTPWTLEIVVFLKTPESVTFTGTLQGQANPQGTAGQGTGVKNHDFTVPAGTSVIVGRLTWTTQSQSNGRLVNDLNLNVLAGTTSEIATTSIAGWEFGMKAADAGQSLVEGARKAQVVPIVCADAAYTLTLYWA